METSSWQPCLENRLEKAFKELRRKNRKALIPFFTAGDPDMETTRRLALGALQEGADILELGVPCSDAMADGPVIQKTSSRALKGGATPEKVLQLGLEMRRETEKPLVLLAYYNQLLQQGTYSFLEKMSQAGFDGIIIPDLPLEESCRMREYASQENVSYVTMCAPHGNDQRYLQAAEAASGFLYCVSTAGTTGVRSQVSTHTLNMLRGLRQLTSKPLALGFGISSREQVEVYSPYVDGIIVGSALLSGLEEKELPDKLAFTASFLHHLRQGFKVNISSQKF